jgi:hypothetical protein
VIAIDTVMGCVDTAILNVNYTDTSNHAHAAWATGTDTVNTQTGGIALTGGTPPGGVYTGPGVSGSTFYPAQANPGPDTVTYSYTDSLGCTSSASRIFVVLGMADIDIENQIQLYPNPANSTITVQSNLFASTGVQITLYDITGRLITLPSERFADKATFNISSLSDGVYWFKFVANGHEASKRFVKME